ncbi:protein of unknown function [Vibrio tapetis subsp. tapetis]|uniref:Uncharacterized protein n=1 Tax=Vibrio tapetis subsp. tapetis TaxID=1671868 RepID=A0A2N8ZH40_9VIBR|nr:protein of unknown function [Vibrio tapetis subsp. tapetis]
MQKLPVDKKNEIIFYCVDFSIPLVITGLGRGKRSSQSINIVSKFGDNDVDLAYSSR